MKKKILTIIIILASIRLMAETALIFCKVSKVDDKEILLRCAMKDKATVSIFNSKGFKLYEEQRDSSFAVKYDLNALPFGEYTIVVKGENFTYEDKIKL